MNLNNMLRERMARLLSSIPHSRSVQLAICTDSPNVMVLTKKILMGIVEGCTQSTLFAYGCTWHDPANAVKDFAGYTRLFQLLRKVTRLSSLFRNIYLARAILGTEVGLHTTRPPSLKILPTSPLEWH